MQRVSARIEVLQAWQAAICKGQRAVQRVAADIKLIQQLQRAPCGGQVAREAVVVQVAASGGGAAWGRAGCVGCAWGMACAACRILTACNN